MWLSEHTGFHCKQQGQVPGARFARKNLRMEEMAVSQRNILSVCLLAVWLLKHVCKAKLPAWLPASFHILSAASLTRLSEEMEVLLAPLPSKIRVSVFICSHVYGL